MENVSGETPNTAGETPAPPKALRMLGHIVY